MDFEIEKNIFLFWVLNLILGGEASHPNNKKTNKNYLRCLWFGGKDYHFITG
jgi:hypothetical protein